MQRDDTAYLLDILIAANKAMSYLDRLTVIEFETSELHLAAVWDTVQRDLPELVKVVALIVPKEDEI